MQFAGQAKPPAGIVFDAYMGRAMDDVLALALLHGLAAKDEARIAAISISNPSLQAASFTDALDRFYNRSAGPFSTGLPIGLADGKPAPDSPLLTVPLANHAYSTGIRNRNDTAEVAPLIRNALTAQYDQNAVIVVTGPATDLVKLLELHDTHEWIVRKVKLLVFAAGAFPDGAADFNLQTDIPSARKLLAEWPTPMVVVGSEIGDALPYPASSIEKDFAWTQNHPVADAYRAYRPMPYDAPTRAMAAVLYAVRSRETYFQLSDPGTVSVIDDGRSLFQSSASGKHHHLILDPAKKEEILKLYTELASAKPPDRKPRFPKP